MININFPRYQGILKKAYLKVAIVIVILAIIGLSTVGNYGVSSDEPMGIKMVQWNALLLAKSKPIPNPVIKYYGTAFNGVAELVYQVKEKLEQQFSSNYRPEPRYLDNPLNYTQIYERTKVKHILNFLVSLLAYVAVAGIVGIWGGKQNAWLGAVTLALFPRFWGHSFYNPKDIPFAATLTLGTFCGALLINYYDKLANNQKHLEVKKAIFYSFLYGGLGGLITGTRLAGFLILFFFVIAHFFVSLEQKKSLRKIFSFWYLYLSIFFSWMITVLFLFPSSWYNPGGSSNLANPVKWFFEGLQTLSKFEAWKGTNLFNGRYIPADSVPWNYIPQWFLITIPGILVILFLIGLAVILSQYKKATTLQKSCTVLLLLQIFFIPLVAILKKSIIYDEIRHFLFVIPGIAAIAAIAVIWINQKIKQKIIRVFTLTLLITLTSSIIIDMSVLHPYEYVYFNRISGGLKQAYNRYETDYWGLSMRQGMEWINQQAQGKPTIVLSSQELFSSKFFADSNIKIALYKSYVESDQEAKRLDSLRPFYYIAKPRWDYQEQLPDCSIVYKVKRQGIPLTIVKKCSE